MKKIIKWILIIFVVLTVVSFFSSDGKKVKKPRKREQERSKQIKEPSKKPSNTPTKNLVKNPTQKKTKPKAKYAILSGKDEKTGEIIVPEISIWRMAGSVGAENMSVGDVPDDTKVEILGKKEVDGVLFYQIQSSVGKVSVLPDDFNARKKAMKKRPKSEWTVPADKTFPVEGWVTADFITNVK